VIGLVAESGSSHCDVSALNPLGFAVADPAAPDAAAEETAEPDAAGAADELPAAGAELAAGGPELAADVDDAGLLELLLELDEQPESASAATVRQANGATRYDRGPDLDLNTRNLSGTTGLGGSGDPNARNRRWPSRTSDTSGSGRA
jgi:hypothetical protein